MDPSSRTRFAQPPRPSSETQSPAHGPKASQSPAGRLIPTILALCVVLGILGVHRLYAGRILTGIAFFFTGGGLVIWWLVDIFQILGGRFTDVDGNRFDRWQ